MFGGKKYHQRKLKEAIEFLYPDQASHCGAFLFVKVSDCCYSRFKLTNGEKL